MDSKTAKIRVKEVSGSRTGAGKPRYVVKDKFDNQYSTLDADLGKKAKKLEGQLVQIEYTTNGKYKNLAGIKAVADDPSVSKSSSYEKDNREGMSFGNARACASTIVAALIGSGYYGNLTTTKGAENLSFEEVVEDHSKITSLIEQSRPSTEKVSKSTTGGETVDDTAKSDDENLFGDEGDKSDDSLFEE